MSHIDEMHLRLYYSGAYDAFEVRLYERDKYAIFPPTVPRSS